MHGPTVSHGRDRGGTSPKPMPPGSNAAPAAARPSSREGAGFAACGGSLPCQLFLILAAAQRFSGRQLQGPGPRPSAQRWAPSVAGPVQPFMPRPAHRRDQGIGPDRLVVTQELGWRLW